MLSTEQIKEKVGYEAAQRVKNGMTIGAGTGSTAYWFIQALGNRIKDGLSCRAVTTSLKTAQLLLQQNIPVIELNAVNALDLVVDGADELDAQLQLIKGGGGALLQEKMVAFSASRYIIIADESKLVENLGRFPLPVEVIPYGYRMVQRRIESRFGKIVSLRKNGETPFETDHHNYILDIAFQCIPDPAEVAAFLKTIPGMVEHGLFLNMAHEAIIGYASGEIKTLQNKTH